MAAQFFYCQTGIQISPWLTRHGSETFWAEAVMIARNMAPVYVEPFFEEWNWMDDAWFMKSVTASRKINREIELILWEPISMHGWLRLAKKMPRKRALADITFKQMRVQDLHTQIRSTGWLSPTLHMENAIRWWGCDEIVYRNKHVFAPLKTWSKLFNQWWRFWI